MEINLEWREQKSELWEDVTYEIRPLRVWAFQELMTFWEGQKNRQSPASSLGLMPVVSRIFPDHVRNLKGVTLYDPDGGSVLVSIDALSTETPLIELAGEIVANLVKISERETT